MGDVIYIWSATREGHIVTVSLRRLREVWYLTSI
jgi:hypothetical protein